MEQLPKIRKQVAFITESGNDIGYGHLYRSIALASSFQEKGCKVFFLTNEESNAIISEQLQGVEVYNDPIAKGQLKNTDVVLFDVHKDSFQRYKSLNDDLIEQTTVTIIDHAFREAVLTTDFVFEVGFQTYKSQLLEKKVGNKLIKCYSGKDFLIFRKEFEKVSPHNPRKNADKILVSMGGSDPSAITEKVAESLELSSNKYNITYVLGNGFSENRLDLLKKIHLNSVHKISYLQNINNMATVMAKHDLAIINGGNTRFELAKLGVPFISIPFQQVQKELSDKIAKEGIGVSLGMYNEITDHEISDKVNDIINNYAFRNKQSLFMTSIFNYNDRYNILERLQVV